MAFASYAAAAAYLVCVFVGGSLKPGPQGGTISDKLVHFVAFGVMTFVTYPASSQLGAARGTKTSVQLGWLWTYTVGAGALLEVWQYFLPYRSTEFGDLVADTAGASLAVVMLLVLRHFPAGDARA